MALLNPTFVFGVIVLLYLSSFVLFAVLRIITGISIQRIGYFSLRRLAYTPRDGCRVEIRGLGFNVHRPTFAQPTWISLVLHELVVTVDIRELEGSKTSDLTEDGDDAEDEGDKDIPAAKRNLRPNRRNPPAVARSETWRHLTAVKEKIKRLHRKVKYLRMIDVVATNSAVNVVDVGNIQVGSFTLAVDTRRKTVDRARFFSRRPSSNDEQRQAEWILTLRSVLFTTEGKDSMEVLDHALLNIHGFLYASREGLRDTAFALKLGRLHIPYDDIDLCRTLYKRCKRDPHSLGSDETLDVFLGNVAQEVNDPGSTNEDLMQTVSDSKEFFSSILRGIKEVQFAVGFVGITKKIDAIRPAANPMRLNAAMKEVGIDLHRLDPKSPSHRMYFPSKDIAHEALAAALSISIGIDDGSGHPERLVYIPMATTTVRTTLPSKTVEFAQEDNVQEKNANIMFANAVVTSPSVDIDPRHLPLLIALLRPKPSIPKVEKQGRHKLISRLLPKANIKFSLHEPVVRIKLKPLAKTEDPDDFDLIISSISSISLDMESSHSMVENLHYSLDGALRLQSHDLYYQTNSGERFNLITTESFDMRVHLAAQPDISVEATGNIQSLSVSMVRPEITDGLRQIVRELRIDVEPEMKAAARTAKQQNFLRSMPEWLLRYQIEATDFNVEVAGADEDISDDTRGVSLHLDAFSAEYRAQKLEGLPRRLIRRRTHSRSITQSDSDVTASPYSPRSKKKIQNYGDGRRLGLHARGFEAQIMETPEKLEVEPFLAMPRFDLVFSVNSDNHGPLFHIQASIRSIYAHYSLYRHYSIGVAAMTVRKALMRTGKDTPRAKQTGVAPNTDRLAPPTPGLTSDVEGLSTITPELMTVDFKSSMVQIKADLPHEPAMMLHIYGLELGRLRWSTPFVSTRLVRIYAEPPRMRNVWARMVGIKGGRVDLRESKRKTSSGKIVEERLIDVTSEAMRIAVPHEVIVNRITDNCVNVLKSVQQLHHRFKTGTNEYILDKKPEQAKHVPKVSIRTRNFLFEMEDGGFEWKLGMIYRTGRLEQMQRIARDEAFQLKMKRVREEESRKGSKARSRSAHHRGRTEHSSTSWFRARSVDALQHSDGPAMLPNRRIPRYDPDGESRGISGQTKVSEDEARHQLDVFNAQSWKRRIDRSYAMTQESMADTRTKFWGPNDIPEDVEETENILSVPQRPALMAANISGLQLVIDKPTFDLSELPDFLHKVGKGQPRDMVYGLLVPMHIAIEMDEAKFTLRDYPLPILHIPGLKPGQSTRQPAVSLKMNFVLAEEYRGMESTRKVRVNVVPPKNMDPLSSNEGSFSIEVRRTIGPVKSFSDVYMDINTSLPTRLTWGPCYQPAVQDLMMVVESFTKPQIDISERVGFWDKLRLNFHSRLHIAWKGDGDLHLGLKGTRDPYHVTGTGAGFLMCWRNDVRWNINAEDDPKRFMTVDSGEYVLAVPDYSAQVREAAKRYHDSGVLREDNTKSGALFKKVVMKLSGKVQWMAGIIFERAIEDGRRSFDFKPHYDVVLKNPQYAKPDSDLPYDAMRGFRSRHIHLTIAVRAPADRDWMGDTTLPSRSYNTVHLTPRFFTHFFHWWGLFGQPMSLPIRQGNLFPGREKNSKKFGRHLATVKYSLLLAPLFLSHIYKHKDVEDYSENAVSATGLKVRFDSFMLDLHQRREEFNTLGRGRNAQGRTTGIKIHAAQLDLTSADLRAVSASIKGTTTEAIKKGDIGSLVTDQDEKPDLSRFTIPDNDYSWIDMDDFVELDWILPSEPHPDTKIMPLAFAPRLGYIRQTDIGNTISGDPTRTSPFGNEPTHFCIMARKTEPKRIQADLIQERLDQLEVQMQTHARNLGEAELKVIRCDSKDEELVSDFEAMRKHTYVLREKKAFLETMVNQMRQEMPPRGRTATTKAEKDELESTMDSMDTQDEKINIPEKADFDSEFTNRFVVHNMQLKWNNQLRNIVLRYIHQNSQRRGFIYYLSRPAVKFILDIVEEQNRAKASKPTKNGSVSGATGTSSSPDPSMKGRDSMQEIEDRIRNFLGEGRKFTNSSFNNNADGSISGTIEDLQSGISDDFSPQSNYHMRLVAPQIQLQSDKNKKHVVLVTAKGMELRVMEVMDKKRLSDNVSGLVQRRFLVNMDSTQFFVTHQKWFSTHLVSMYAGSKYGTSTGSSWPPWVPMEVMFDFQTDPFGFKRVVQKTSAMLRYDKYNTLRLKYNDEVNEDKNEKSTESSENRMDNLWVEFPQARAICNSSQYYAMYVIVLDLLMYSEPLEKTRSERLEKIMLASDFSDLSGAPEMVQRLQARIHQLEEIKYHFQIYSKYLDKRGWEDRLSLEKDLASCEDELFFVMKAITTSQRKYDVHSDSNGLLKWNIAARDIVWHLMQSSNEPLVQLQLKDLQYDRTDNSDGSHMNRVRVGRLLGLNLLDDATYPEIIAPYQDEESTQNLQDSDMVHVYWYMLEAIAGIPVMDRFEVDLFPVKIQLEREVGKRLFEYIFPGIEGSDKMSGVKNDSPLMVKQLVPGQEDADDDSINSASVNSSSRLSVHSAEKDSSAFSTRAGSLELRLRPTLSSAAPTSPTHDRHSRKGLTVNTGDNHPFHLFRSSGTGKTVSKKSSYDSLRAMNSPRPGTVPRSSTGFSSKDGRDSTASDRKTRFGLRGKNHDDKQQSDDLTKMIDRASNYMTFSSIKMPSVVLCLSYKGKEQRNFEDLHDFVFRLPAIEWQNKTWSNLDLALALKKAVIKALISHTGAIIGNKFSRHRPNAEQRNRLRELASSSVVIQPSASSVSQSYAGSINDSDDSSLYGGSQVDWSRSPPRSTHSSIPAPNSRSSSVASARSHRRTSATPAPGLPSFLTRTPPTPVEGPSRTGTNDSSASRVELLGSSSGNGVFTVPHRQILKSATGDGRPSTSASSERRRSGTSGIRDKLSALTHRMREGSSSSGLPDDETTEGADEGNSGTSGSRSSLGKRMSWAPSNRTKTG